MQFTHNGKNMDHDGQVFPANLPSTVACGPLYRHSEALNATERRRTPNENAHGNLNY